ncbi:hypothetical protein L6232_20580, partial [Shewanella sp. C31]|nr:hypothetical protein [Shewanella electrica]
AQGEDPPLALLASGHLAYYLAEPLLGKDLPRARAALERGLALLDRVGPELAGRFLNDAARVPYEEGRVEESLGLLEEALRRLGLRPKARQVVAWREERSVREALEALQERLYSFTQAVPEEVHQRVMPRLWALAEAEFGDLDQSFPVEKSFHLRTSRLG